MRDGPLKWPHRRVGVLNPNSRGHTKARENFAQRARRVPCALTYSQKNCPQFVAIGRKTGFGHRIHISEMEHHCPKHREGRLWRWWAMASGFLLTRMIVTSGQTRSVLRSRIVLPCCHCSANDTSSERCLELTLLMAGVLLGCVGAVAMPRPCAHIRIHGDCCSTASGSIKLNADRPRSTLRLLNVSWAVWVS